MEIFLLPYSLLFSLLMMFILCRGLVFLRIIQVLAFDLRLWCSVAALLTFSILRFFVKADLGYLANSHSLDTRYYTFSMIGILLGVTGYWLKAFFGLPGLTVKGAKAKGLVPQTYKWKNVWKPVNDQNIRGFSIFFIIICLGGSAFMLIQPERIRWRLVDERNRLATALENGDVIAMQQLYEEGIQIKFLDNSPTFDIAVRNEDLKMVEWFLSPSDNRKLPYPYMFDVIGTGNRKLLDLVLQKTGMDPDHLFASLVASIQCEQPETFEYLLANGANVKKKHRDNQTTLHIATMAPKSNPVIVKKLLELGVNPFAKDRRNNTAFDYARERSGYARGNEKEAKEEIVRLLEKYQKK